MQENVILCHFLEDENFLKYFVKFRVEEIWWYLLYPSLVYTSLLVLGWTAKLKTEE